MTPVGITSERTAAGALGDATTAVNAAGMSMHDNADGALQFADESVPAPIDLGEPWTILVVDDEDSVHEVTRLALAEVTFDGRPLRFIEARSSLEARARLQAHPETALILLDVVMETDSAGLGFVEYVRNELFNSFVRIALRTGQPGQAPERKVIVEYDISDYKTKSELTATRLFMTVIGALRVYRQLHELETHRRLAVAASEAQRRFFPREFLELLGKQTITQVALGDQIQREVTVMFADIRGFTARAETMSPAQCFAFVNHVFAAICPLVREHRGFIDKFLGDGFLALFPASADDAVQAAVAIQRRLGALNEGHPEPPVRLGIGLHTGTVMMGTVGELERMEATVLSDDVNIAARIEAFTKHHDANVVCSEQTLLRIDPAARQMRSFGHVRVPGKLREIAVFELIEADPDPVRAHKQASAPEFAAGVEHMRRGEFAAACAQFRRVLDADPSDGPARRYLQRADDGLRAETIRDR